MLVLALALAAETTDPWALAGQITSFAGVSGLFLWLWKGERELRQAAEAKVLEVTREAHAREVELLTTDRDRLAEVLGGTANTLSQVRDAMGKTVEKAIQPDPHKRLEAAVEELTRQIRGER